MSVSDAITNQQWADAMKVEIDSLQDNSVWDLVQLPEGRKPVGSKWLFKVKTNADGSVERCKACLVAQGYSQKEGLDYDKTFSPVVRSESFHSVITLASKNGLKLHHMDITTAFLNGNLKEEVYMKQPEGFLANGQEHLVCRLRKCIYGLKQSPRCWNQALDAQLKLMGFKQSTSDPCIYTSTTESGGLLILAVYVDDILLAGKSQQKIAQVKADLRKLFQLKDMGELHYFLGVSEPQKRYGLANQHIPKLLSRNLEWNTVNLHANTPMAPGTKLLKATEQSEIIDPTLYQSAVGSLLYLSGWTGLDIAFVVSQVAKFCFSPTKEHWSAVKRILRYLKGTPNYGLSYSRNDDINGALIRYSDADWAGDVNYRKSTSGYVFMMSGAAVLLSLQRNPNTLHWPVPCKKLLGLDVYWKIFTMVKLSQLLSVKITNQQFASPRTTNITARPNTLSLCSRKGYRHHY